MNHLTKFATACLVLILAMVNVEIASAASTPGTKCTKVGLTSKFGQVNVKCVKINSKFLWQKIPLPAASANPSNSVTPTRSNISGHGILSVDCSKTGTAILELRDPRTGLLVGQSAFSLVVHPGLPSEIGFELCYPPGPEGGAASIFLRERFSWDFSKLAYVGLTLPDGSTHVGYLDILKKSYVDVTALTREFGFGAGIPVDSSPIFDPQSEVFYFLRGSAIQGANGIESTDSKEVHKFDLKTKLDSKIGSIETSILVGSSEDSWITLQDGLVLQGDSLLSPDGNFVAHADLGGVAISRVTGLVNRFTSNSFFPVSTDFYTAKIGGYPRTTVFGWLDSHSLFVGVDGESGIFTFRFDPSIDPQLEPTNLLPVSNAKNTNALLSPDGSQVVFLHTLLSTSTVYTIDVSKLEDPKLLTSNFLGRLVAWK